MADTPKDKKTSLADDLRAKIAALAETSSDADRKTYAAMVARAKSGDQLSEVVTLTPGVMALIFINSNVHNRDWSAGKTLAFQGQMLAGLWRWNGASLVWYKDGDFADGQHRTAAGALSGLSITTTVVYGMDKRDIVTVDTGRPRTAAQAAQLDGVVDSSKKSTIMRSYDQYERKRLSKKGPPLSQIELKDLIIQHDETLTEALLVAEGSRKDIARPILGGDGSLDAAKISFLMLSAPHAWPVGKVLKLLQRLQLGQSVSGQGDPIFQVADAITNDQKTRSNSKEKLTEPAKLGMALHAFALTERGVTSIQSREFKAMKKNQLPAPDMPILTMELAA